MSPTSSSTGPEGLSVQGLSVQGLGVRYGGLCAVDGLHLEAPPGRITALIGPNGAGKTSTFNAISGLVRASEGSIRFNGVDITHASPVRRGRLGLGRTFQRMEVCEGLTVHQNVVLGCEARFAGSSPLRHLFSARGERQTVQAEVERALEVCGIGHLVNRKAGGISTGERRLLELARVVAGRFPVLLLDEPSSGLDTVETRRFGAILQSLVAGGDVGILLVEHDMGLVMDISEYVYVVDFGRPIFDGPPAEVRASEIVRAAYLGSSELVG
jgi:ABC-type branched-subunit amino acid transport system ATPase component